MPTAISSTDYSMTPSLRSVVRPCSAPFVAQILVRAQLHRKRGEGKYLGPDTPELRERIERLQQQREGLREREEGRRSLVQILRVKGVPRIDAATGKVLQALTRAGVFRLRGVLVGTHAFRVYPLILGVVMPEAHHATEDIDPDTIP
jgi:hypothetical protein